MIVKAASGRAISMQKWSWFSSHWPDMIQVWRMKRASTRVAAQSKAKCVINTTRYLDGRCQITAMETSTIPAHAAKNPKMTAWGASWLTKPNKPTGKAGKNPAATITPAIVLRN